MSSVTRADVVCNSHSPSGLSLHEGVTVPVSCRLDPALHGAQRVLVTVLSRKVVTTEASLTGCGGVDEGWTVRGSWSADLL